VIRRRKRERKKTENLSFPKEEGGREMTEIVHTDEILLSRNHKVSLSEALPLGSAVSSLYKLEGIEDFPRSQLR
jgi:hypothetical protein